MMQSTEGAASFSLELRPPGSGKFAMQSSLADFDAENVADAFGSQDAAISSSFIVLGDVGGASDAAHSSSSPERFADLPPRWQCNNNVKVPALQSLAHGLIFKWTLLLKTIMLFIFLCCSCGALFLRKFATSLQACVIFVIWSMHQYVRLKHAHYYRHKIGRRDRSRSMPKFSRQIRNCIFLSAKAWADAVYPGNMIESSLLCAQRRINPIMHRARFVNSLAQFLVVGVLHFGFCCIDICCALWYYWLLKESQSLHYFFLYRESSASCCPFGLSLGLQLYNYVEVCGHVVSDAVLIMQCWTGDPLAFAGYWLRVCNVHCQTMIGCRVLSTFLIYCVTATYENQVWFATLAFLGPIFPPPTTDTMKNECSNALYSYTAEDHTEARVHINNTRLTVDFDSLPTAFRPYFQANGLFCKAMKTNGNGACAIHSVFGRPSEAYGNREMFKDGARSLAVALLGKSADALLTIGVDKVHVEAICNSFWLELAKPHLQGESTTEGRLFWEALANNDPALAKECEDCLITCLITWNVNHGTSAAGKERLLKDSASFSLRTCRRASYYHWQS